MVLCFLVLFIDGKTTATTTVQGGDDRQSAQVGDGGSYRLIGDVESAGSGIGADSSSIVGTTTATTTVQGGDDRQSGTGGGDTPRDEEDASRLVGDVRFAGSGIFVSDSSSIVGTTAATTTVQGGDDTQNAGDGDEFLYGM